MANAAYIVKPVYKALQLLQHVALAQRPLSLTEISYQAKLPKTTTYRYLYTLRELGFIAHDHDNDTYQLGLYAWELGQLAGEQLQIRRVARPLMEELRRRFDETINLGVIDGAAVVYIDVVESRRSLRMQPKPGEHDAVYSTSIGKAILAFLPEDEWGNHLPSRLTARTPQTITSLKDLKQELLQTRQRGYARDNGENEDGARCIGVPIFDQRGRAMAALSISAPASRLNDTTERTAAAALVAAAQMCSQQLGYTPERPAE